MRVRTQAARIAWKGILWALCLCGCFGWNFVIATYEVDDWGSGECPGVSNR